MRGVESLMLAGLVGLLGLGVWQGRHWLPNLLPTGTPSLSAPGVNAKAPAGVKSSTKIPAHLPRKLAKLDAATMDRLLAESSSTTTVVVPIPSLPGPASIKAGTTRTELRARYGDPTLDISARKNGQLVERFYYLSSDETQLTVATLLDGNVASIETVSR